MINHEHKCIFIHIPKCGGSSVERHIDNRDWWVHAPAEKHLTANDARNKYAQYWDDYFKFSIVRNPYDIEVSWYHFKKHPFIHGREIGFSEFIKDESINTVAKISHGLTDKRWENIIPSVTDCYEYLSIDDTIAMDYIGKLENIRQDFNTICDKIGIPRQQLLHVNKTNHKHYTEYYDDETKQIVAEKYAKDIEYFGYEFGE